MKGTIPLETNFFNQYNESKGAELAIEVTNCPKPNHQGYRIIKEGLGCANKKLTTLSSVQWLIDF